MRWWPLGRRKPQDHHDFKVRLILGRMAKLAEAGSEVLTDCDEPIPQRVVNVARPGYLLLGGLHRRERT